MTWRISYEAETGHEDVRNDRITYTILHYDDTNVLIPIRWILKLKISGFRTSLLVS
jgi:hypothetical protein